MVKVPVCTEAQKDGVLTNNHPYKLTEDNELFGLKLPHSRGDTDLVYMITEGVLARLQTLYLAHVPKTSVPAQLPAVRTTAVGRTEELGLRRSRWQRRLDRTRCVMAQRMHAVEQRQT